MRQCPVCVDKPMQSLPLKTVEYERCTSCGGMWFEAGELSSVVPPESLARMLRAAREEKPLCRKCAAAIAEGECTSCGVAHVRCPDCGRQDLVNLIVGSTEIEVCNPCGGFWLDAGELQAVASAEGVELTESRGVVRGLPHAGAAAASMLAITAPQASQSNAAGVVADVAEVAVEVAGGVVDVAGTVLARIDVVDLLGEIFSAMLE